MTYGWASKSPLNVAGTEANKNALGMDLRPKILLSGNSVRCWKNNSIEHIKSIKNNMQMDLKISAKNINRQKRQCYAVRQADCRQKHHWRAQDLLERLALGLAAPFSFARIARSLSNLLLQPGQIANVQGRWRHWGSTACRQQ